MRKSIATVSLSGTLDKKLAAAARAGFDGVELFENDLITCPSPPAEVRRWAEDLGLTIELYQPFRDFEAMPEAQFERNLRRARRKLDLMTQLGAATLLVCSNISGEAIDDDDLAAAQLYDLADLAAERGIRVAYEALAWGRHVSDYRHADAIVVAAGHPHLGNCLDSFHILSRGDDPAGILEIPGERIIFLQLADAPNLRMDVLQWSRHHRCFPGQGAFDLAAFTAHVVATGYRGPLSLEVFSDTFRQADATSAAVDAVRSLLHLEASLRDRLSAPDGGNAEGRSPVLDRIELFDPPAPPALHGYEFVEVALDAGWTDPAERLLSTLGFARAGQHRSKPVTHWQQGGVNVLLNTSSTGRRLHGPEAPTLAALGVRTTDPVRSANRAEALRAPVLPRRRGPGEADLPGVRATGGTEIQFCGDGTWLTDFKPAPGGPGSTTGLTHVDHVNLSLEFDQFDEAILFFRAVLGLEPHESLELPDPYGLVRSRALTSPDQTLRLALNLPRLRGQPAGTGVGLQHVAFGCPDIFTVARTLRAAGLEPLPIPANYYDDLAARFELPDDYLTSLRDLGLLYDRTPAGEYLHTYTPMLGDRLFFEIVQRTGDYTGYGAANTPIRLAAQKSRADTR